MTEDPAGDAPPSEAAQPRPKPGNAVPKPADASDGQPADAPKQKPSKAERLAAKAERLRAADERLAANRAARAEAGAQSSTPTGLVVALVALGVVVAGLIAVLVVGYLSWQHQRDVNSARAAALKSAKTFAVDFGSYDYQHLDTEFAAVAKKMTPGFAKDYTSTSAKLKPTLMQYKTHVSAKIQGAGVTSVSTSKAVVLVFLDQTVQTSQSSTPRIDRNRLEVHLQKSGGKWLVSQLLAK